MRYTLAHAYKHTCKRIECLSARKSSAVGSIDCPFLKLSLRFALDCISLPVHPSHYLFSPVRALSLGIPTTTQFGANSKQGQIVINIGYYLGMLDTNLNENLIILPRPN